MNKQIFILRGLVFSYYATQAVLLPFMPIYFAAKGYSSVQIGLLMMLGPFVAVFAQPMWGYLSDRLQTVKKIVFLLWTCTILSSIGLFLAGNFTVALMFTMSQYFFMMPSAPLLDGITIKSAQQSNKSYGSIRLWGSIGFATIAICSPYVLNWIGGVSQIQYIYWAEWIPAMLFLIFLKDDPSSSGGKITLGAIRSLLHNRAFMWFLFMVFIIMIPHRMNDSLFGLYMSNLGASDTMVGWAWALAAFSEVPVFALLGKYMYKFNELALLGLASVLFVIRWTIYSFVSDPWVLLFLSASAAITFGVFWIVAVAYAVRLVPEHLRSTGQSFLSAVFLGLAGITGGAVGGWINELWGGSSMYVFAAILATIASVLFLSTNYITRKKDAY